MSETRTRRLGALFYPAWEMLDTCGPLEIFGNLQGMVEVVTVAQHAGPVTSVQGPAIVATYGFDDCPPLDLLLIPGGLGTRAEIDNPAMIDWLRRVVPRCEVTMTVCTGTALLARAGLLDGRRATTNKMFFQWVADQGPRVEWIKVARWVDDGDIVTASGVSAGIDMALAVVARLFGPELSDNLAIATEYDWHRDANWDPFAKIHGLV